MDLTRRGEDCRLLNKSFVTLICIEDIFYKGRYIYTFENWCREEPNLVLGDRTVETTKRDSKLMIE